MKTVFYYIRLMRMTVISEIINIAFHATKKSIMHFCSISLSMWLVALGMFAISFVGSCMSFSTLCKNLLIALHRFDSNLVDICTDGLHSLLKRIVR